MTINSIEDTAPFCQLCDEWTDYASATNSNIDFDQYGLQDSTVHSCKPIIILLPEGVHKQQPMCSMFVQGTLD